MGKLAEILGIETDKEYGELVSRVAEDYSELRHKAIESCTSKLSHDIKYDIHPVKEIVTEYITNGASSDDRIDRIIGILLGRLTAGDSIYNDKSAINELLMFLHGESTSFFLEVLSKVRR